MQVLVCDDHPMVAAAMGATIENLFDAQVHIVHSFGEARKQSACHEFDLCLLDINIPGEIARDNIKAIRTQLPDIPIMVFSGSDSDDDLCMALELELQGFLPKSAPPEVVEAAVRLVMAGGSYLPDRVGQLALSRTRPASPASEADAATLAGQAAPYGHLTDRQMCVLEHLAKGRSNKEVAIELGISPATVKAHVAQIIGILGATNRTGAVAQARELGIL